MFKMSNMTIKDKLILIIMLVSLSALVLTAFILLGFVHVTFRNSMVQDILTDADMAADNCNVALAFRNIEDVEKTLTSLKSKSSIVFGGVYTTNGENFAEYYRDDIDSSVRPAQLKKDGYYFENGFLTVFKSIVLDDEKIGMLCIRSDLIPLHEIFKNSTAVITIVLLLALLMAYFLSARLQKIISVSILKLAEVAKVVSEKKDYSTRAIKQSNDEIGLLIDAFNEMLEQIQQRDSTLVNTNEKLSTEIAKRKKAKKALEKLNKDLESTVWELMRANQQLRDFTHITAHDLKTPLRGISTLANWISTDYSDVLDVRGKKNLTMLIKRVQRMYHLIDSILEYSNIIRIKEKEQEVDLNALLAEVIHEIEAPENVQISIDNNLPAVVCDKELMMRVFENLLSNAVKHAGKPRGQIKVNCEQENNFWRFSVIDNGLGIEEKYFKKIFQMFQTLSTQEGFESSGVGLSVVKKIVELYGGKIWVESKGGQGSTFSFTLPKHKERVKDEKLQSSTVG